MDKYCCCLNRLQFRPQSSISNPVHTEARAEDFLHPQYIIYNRFPGFYSCERSDNDSVYSVSSGFPAALPNATKLVMRMRVAVSRIVMEDNED
ncbi:hypothetical protein BaRGS_00027418 [Batillaria attramentaria]|uniref:Uncharacterized protein n=1 Tax=Batillaria attramentaria TaxID=370345 RepID=A0ABD0K2F4_9CAEN